jgi:ABC-2 type transport system permease protein
MATINSLASLLLRDLIFLAIVAAIVGPICVKKRATFAVLKRNFVGYFSNPTGYVFLCLFVLLTSFAAFWPHEFFNANLANLDQLNRYLPLIMLIFIPAITMSIWAEERGQGTDELLLTLPAGDFDIVFGKYIAAASIFTASLLFSQVCNFSVLAALTIGDLDVGLFFATYFGYWLVGMAMLAVGMVASFLTSNLTVGFILGAAFNAPLVFAVWADTIVPNPTLARLAAGWSIGAQFDDFGRGVISLSSVAYFALLVVVGLYLSMVFIGSRHWTGGRDGTSLLGHYLVRTIALMVLALGVNYLFANNDVLNNFRADLTQGKVSSLSPDTKQLLRELKADHTIKIEAFISGQVPEAYAKTRADLVSMLKEFRASAGSGVDVQIHVLDQGSQEAIELASMAEKRFGIVPEPVRTRTRGAIKDEDIFLAAAFTCGLEKVIVPFFDYGIPVEYELIRSISTVAKTERKKVGIVRTDAQLYGGFSFAGGRPQNIPKQALVEELEKQYDVEEVDPNNPVEEGTYDVMIVVQPSSLSPEAFDNVLEAVRNGQPTAIFEDPRPIFLTMAPATGEPKMPPGGMGGMFGGGGGPQPKGEIQKLWNMLGLEVPGETSMMGLYAPDIAWQEFNPYLKLQIQGIPDSWVFCRREAPGAEEAINDDSPITAGLEEIFFPVPGVIKPDKSSDLKFTPLVKTGDMAGTISFQDFMDNRDNMFMMKVAQGQKKGSQVIAARIQGTLSRDHAMSDAGLEVAQADTDDAADEGDGEGDSEEGAGKEDAAAAEAGPAGGQDDAEAKEQKEKQRPIDVIYVADIDLMISTFLRIRARPGEDEEINWNFENVNFLLNIVDVLSGDDDYIAIRKRKPRHSTLRLVEQKTQQMRAEEFEERYTFQQKFDDAIKEIEEQNKKEIEKVQKELEELQEKQRKEGQAGISFADLQKKMTDLAIVQERLNRKLEVRREQLRRERDDNIERIRRDIDLDILAIKNEWKFWAVVLPPIPPLLVGLVVYVRRRLREREGVARSRMR